MDFSDIDEIKKAGFTGFKKISELFVNRSTIPKTKGVYLILNLDKKQPNFLSVGSGGYFKRKNPNVCIEELEANWIDNTNVVYIGKATSLKNRLGDYLKFGQGKNIGHYGGRYIWQLKNSRDLVVCWKVLTTGNPRDFEITLMKLFRTKFNNRPFANLKD